jgi:hypothetical protein
MVKNMAPLQRSRLERKANENAEETLLISCIELRMSRKQEQKSQNSTLERITPGVCVV